MTSRHTHHILDEAAVDAVLDAAERHALAHDHRVVIAVVERSGELVALRRTPGAQVASSRVAVDKARTAAIFIRPSRELEQQVSSGRLGALALHGARALTGGIPLKLWLAPLSVTYRTRSSGESAIPLGLSNPSATTAVSPVAGSWRYTKSPSIGAGLKPWRCPYEGSVNQIESSAATTTSLGELKGSPRQSSTTGSRSPVRRSTRLIRAGCQRLPCSHTIS
jgi:uncharacterized protein GlcG (DUF336 family)